MADRATRFLQAFNQIEQELRGRVERRESDPKHLSFPMLLERSPELTERQVDRLKSFADLRNAIVHNPRDVDDEVIADPRESAVEWLEKQVQVILDPPLVMQVLQLSKPTVLRSSDDLGVFLQIVREKEYSQVPVQDEDGALHLVTTNTVTRWLAGEYITGTGAAIEHVRLSEIHRFAEDCDDLVLRPRNLQAAEAVRIFAGQEGRNAPAAIVLTEHGKNHQTPLGLCSQSDVARLLHALAV